jgi:hypothetical protein
VFVQSGQLVACGDGTVEHKSVRFCAEHARVCAFAPPAKAANNTAKQIVLAEQRDIGTVCTIFPEPIIANLFL